MYGIYATTLMLTGALLLWGCQAQGQETPRDGDQGAPQPPKSTTQEPAAKAAGPSAQREPKLDPEAEDKRLRGIYTWLASSEGLPRLEALTTRFSPPAGFKRVEVKPKSFAAYLRGLPLRTDRDAVKLYDGRAAPMPSAGIVPLDLGSKDVHQCADSVIRLHAEYLWSQGRADEAQYHYTSGDLARWRDWRQGKVLKVRGNKVTQVTRSGMGKDHKAYRKYLDDVFMYASTRSLHRDAKKLKGEQVRYEAGDFFLAAGSPGHVVILLDVVEHADGRRAALVGQGYLPAREFHVIKASGPRVLDGVWFLLPDAKHHELATPTWAPFGDDRVWRFEAR